MTNPRTKKRGEKRLLRLLAESLRRRQPGPDDGQEDGFGDGGNDGDDSDDDNDGDEGYGGDDDLPGGGNGGPRLGPANPGSRPGNGGSDGFDPGPGDDDGDDDDEEEDDDDDDGMFMPGTPGRHNTPREDSRAPSLASQTGGGFPNSGSGSTRAANARSSPLSPTVNESGRARTPPSRRRTSPLARRRGPFVFDDEDEDDQFGSTLPGSLAFNSRRSLPSANTPRGRAPSVRQASESPEIKQETPPFRKRKEPGEPVETIDLTLDDSVEIKTDPDGPHTKQPCISQDIDAVLDLTGDDEEVRDVTAQYATQAEHRLRCPRCENFFQAKLPRMGNYRHACPPGPVVAEHSNEQSYEAWTQRYQDRRSEPI